MTRDWGKLASDLERLLKLRSLPLGMKLFTDKAEMEAVPRIRRPTAVHTLDQVVAQAARLGWTVGITADDLFGTQCGAVVGLGNRKDAAWASGENMVGVWFDTIDDATAHRTAMNCVADGHTRRWRSRRYPAAGSTRRTLQCFTEALAKNGLRYPFPQYGIQQDVRAGMAANYK